jgi:hypothetical protein
MSFSPSYGSFSSADIGCSYSDAFGAAPKKKIGPLRAWKLKNGIAGAKAKTIAAKKSSDGKTCAVTLTYASQKGAALTFKLQCKGPNFKPFAKLCAKAAAGKEYKAGGAEAAAASDEASHAEAKAVDAGVHVEGAVEASDLGAGMFGGGMFGAASSGQRQLKYTHEEALKAYPRFADSNATLRIAYKTNKPKLAAKAMMALARERDAAWHAAALAAQGKSSGQVAHKTLAALSTGGISLLLPHIAPGAAGKARAKAAAKHMDMGDAAAAIFRSWKEKLGDDHTSGANRLPYDVVASIRAASVPGGVVSYGSSHFGDAERAERAKGVLRVSDEVVQSGPPSTGVSYLAASDLGAFGLGALGALFAAPFIF